MMARLPALLLAAMLLWPQSAAAMDLKMVAERFLDHLGQLGVQTRWKSIDVGENEVWIEDVWIADGDMNWFAHTIYLREFYERPDYYLIGVTSVPLVEAEHDGMRATFQQLEAFGVRVPIGEDVPPDGTLVDFDEAYFGSLHLEKDTSTALSMGKAHIGARISDDGSEVSYDGAIESIEVDLSQVADPTARETLLAMGYEDIKGYLEYEWTLRGSPASVTVDYLGLSLVGAGTVSMTGEFAPAGDAKIPFAGIHRAGVLLDMDGLALNNAMLRFDNDGVAGKLLDYVVAQQGMGTGVAVLQLQTLAALQVGMSLGITYVPQFMGALNAFLASPESLELRAEPAEPVALGELKGMEAGEIADRLSLTITANN